MKSVLILLILLFGFAPKLVLATEFTATVEINGDHSVCAGDSYSYSAIVENDIDFTCGMTYTWEVFGGVIEGNSNDAGIVYNTNWTSINVIWNDNEGDKGIVLTVNPIADGFCIGYEDGIIGGASKNIILWDGCSAISEGNPAVGQLNTQKYDDTAERFIRLSADTLQAGIYRFNFLGYNFQDGVSYGDRFLHVDIPGLNDVISLDYSGFFTESLNIDPLITEPTEITFYYGMDGGESGTVIADTVLKTFVPNLLLSEDSVSRPPRCVDGSGDFVFQFDNYTKYDTIGISLYIDNGFSPYIKLIKEDGKFVINTNATYLDVDSVEQNLNLPSGSGYKFTASVLNSEGAEIYGGLAHTIDTIFFTIPDFKKPEISNLDDNHLLECADSDEGSITGQAAHGKYKDFLYQLLKVNSSGETSSLGTPSADLDFSNLGQGTYLVRALINGCGAWNSANYVEREITISPKEIVIDSALAPTDTLDCDYHTTSLNITASRQGGGMLDYQLQKHINEEWIDQEMKTDTSGVEVKFYSQPIGAYQVLVKYADCTSWSDATVDTSQVANISQYEIEIKDNFDLEVEEGTSSLLCPNSTTSLTIAAEKGGGGVIYYRLQKQNEDENWEYYQSSKYGDSGETQTFTNVGIGTYRALMYSCNGSDDSKIESDSILTIDVQEITFSNNNLTADTEDLPCYDSRTKLRIQGDWAGNETGEITYRLYKEGVGFYIREGTAVSGNEIVFQDIGPGTYSVRAYKSGCSQYFRSEAVEINSPDDIDANIRISRPGCYTDINGSFSFTLAGGPDDESDYTYSLKRKEVGYGTGFEDLPSQVDFNFVDNSGEVKDLPSYNISNGKNYEYQFFVSKGDCDKSTEFRIRRRSRPDFSLDQYFNEALKYNSQNGRFYVRCVGDTADVVVATPNSQLLSSATISVIDELGENVPFQILGSRIFLEQITAGTYTFSGIDGQGCEFYTRDITVYEAEEPFEINRVDDATRAVTLFTTDDSTDYHLAYAGSSEGRFNISPIGGLENYVGDGYNFKLFIGDSLLEKRTVKLAGEQYFFDSLSANLVYKLEVWDYLGCLKDTTFQLHQPDSIKIFTQLNTYEGGVNISCKNGTDTLRISSSGGIYPHFVEVRKLGSPVPVFQAEIDSASQELRYAAVDSGQYIVSITDKYDFEEDALKHTVSSDTLTVTEPTEVLDFTSTISPPLCVDSSDGSIIIEPSGGVPFDSSRYDIYFFEVGDDSVQIGYDRASEATIIDSAGFYRVEIYDAAGCSVIQELEIENIDPLSLEEPYVESPSCVGDNSGSISVQGTGGWDSLGYKFNLYLNDSIIEEVSEFQPDGSYEFQNLFAGDYEVAIYDSVGCERLYNIELPERADSLVFTNVNYIPSTCINVENAQIIVMSQGGDGQHLLSIDEGLNWIEANNISAQQYQYEFINLEDSAGYTIWLKDSNYSELDSTSFCLKMDSIYIPAHDFTISHKKNQVSCFGGKNGSITLEPKFGSEQNPESFTYQWFKNEELLAGESSHQLTAIGQGTYEVKVRYQDLICTEKIHEILISQPAEAFAVEVLQTTPINCEENSGINLQAQISGGWFTPHYRYQVDAQQWQEIDIDDYGILDVNILLDTGAHTLKVEDAKGCLSETTFEVGYATPSLDLTELNPVSCFGKNDGEIIVQGAYSLMDYVLIGAEDTLSRAAQANGNFNGLLPGNYKAVASKGGCISDTLLIELIEPAPLVAQAIMLKEASCGKFNGQLSVEISGGTAPFDTVWVDETDSHALSSGNYTVEITDARGCTASDVITLTEKSDISIEVIEFKNTSCGYNNGTVSLEISEAMEPYRVYWNGIEGSVFREDLAAGDYEIKVVDFLGCEQLYDTTILESDPLSADILDFTYTECGNAFGTVELSVHGGTSPYRIKWPEEVVPTGDFTAESLMGGVPYEAEITDARGCSIDFVFSVPNLGDLTVQIETVEPRCGNASGSITATVSGGLLPFSYEWSKGDFEGSQANNLLPGNYVLTVTDHVGCKATKVIDLKEQQDVFPAYELEIQYPSCNNNDGQIEVVFTEDSEDFQISWPEANITSPIIGGLGSGYYTAIMSNPEGCILEIPAVHLKDPAYPEISLTELIQPLCGRASGSIQLQSNTPGMSYEWSHEEGLNSPLAAELAPGEYRVFGVSPLGCKTDTLTFNLLDQPSDLQIQLQTVISATCISSPNGSAKVKGLQGAPPYTYLWDDASMQTTAEASNLTPGTYRVEVTDANLCSQLLEVQIGSIEPMVISGFEEELPSCFDADNGTLKVNVLGGTGNYQFLWSNGSVSNPASGFEAGTHSVKVFDGEYCVIEAEVVLGAPAEMKIVQTVESPVCSGDSNGFARLSVSGGTGSYTYLWEDGSTDHIRNDLKAGTYLVEVFDENICSKEIEVLIPANEEIAVDYVVHPPKCPGADDGAIVVTDIRNANNASVSWSNGKFGKTLSNVGEGQYTLSLQTGDGCLFTELITITDPLPIEVNTIELENVKCKGGREGSISFQVNGGAGNYQYLWDDGVSSKNRSNLSAGNYEVRIRDSNACELYEEFVISEPDALSLTSEIQAVSCFGGDEGSISVEVTGGTTPYSFKWTDGYTEKNRSELQSGNYRLLITDANNCTLTEDFVIKQPGPLQVSYNLTEPSCYGDEDGAIEISVSGGTSPYEVEWGNNDDEFLQEDLSASSYNFTISDANGCEINRLVNLEQPAQVRISSLKTANPICYQEPSGYAKIITAGGVGVIEVEWDDGTIGHTRNDLMAGTHHFTYYDENGCSNEGSVSLTDPPQVLITGMPDELFVCEGGSIVINAEEDEKWSSYKWTADNGFSSTESEVELSALGIYTVTTTTPLGCKDSHEIEVKKYETPLEADFILTTDAVIGDTIRIIDVSWPVPDYIEWEESDDPDFYVVDQNNDNQEVIFYREGKFEIGMYAYRDDCGDYIRKNIEVISRAQAQANNAARAASDWESEIKLSIFPNPNKGKFRINLQSEYDFDVEILIVSFNSGNVVKKVKGKSSKNYAFQINEDTLPPGIYLIVASMGDQQITRKIIVR